MEIVRTGTILLFFCCWESCWEINEEKKSIGVKSYIVRQEIDLKFFKIVIDKICKI